MRIARIAIKNFRGIREGTLLLPPHVALVGDNNIGKSTVLEAMDLVLGPDRLGRRPVVDEHDFYAGDYLDAEKNPILIEVEVVVVDLDDAQQRHFRDHLEWWKPDNSLISEPPAEGTDAPGVLPALRVVFEGNYDAEEDDFVGNTYFASPGSGEERSFFRSFDKRKCGFLYLRALRTGTRALSLERGSLLDIFLRLKETQLKMWEGVLKELRALPVADDPEIGITRILDDVEKAVHQFVPEDWVSGPHMRVSDLTRETLRRTLTVFMNTGAMRLDGEEYAAPFQHQGTGTINTLVLAMLSLIAELKASVIFAMEEPEVAIPPHAQKRIITSVRNKSAQAIFTSHSPYVLEEFKPEEVLVLKRNAGVLSGVPATMPPAVAPKKYKEEFRRRFCEALLARRVLITEGRTEYDAVPAAATRLHEVEPATFRSLGALGIAVIDAGTDSQVAPLGNHFKALGKTVLAIYDLQVEPQKSEIKAAVDYAFEGPVKGFEQLLLNQTAEPALRRFAAAIVAAGDWPSHLAPEKPEPATPLADLRAALQKYLKRSKGEGTAAGLLQMCTRAEMPKHLVDTLLSINHAFIPVPTAAVLAVPAAAVAASAAAATLPPVSATTPPAGPADQPAAPPEGAA